ncbi:hypothetical protein Tco_1165089 [Tanacetum coccineum]
MKECHLLLTYQVNLANPEGHQIVPDMSKPLPLGVHQIESEQDYDISVAYGISHLWFKRKEFYITRHSAPADRSKVRSHMRILSVVSLKTLERYGYTYLKEIVLRRANYKEYRISEADFKNLHPNDFEDLYPLNLQGQLNHLSGADKVHLFNAVNLWVRNIVIRKLVEDLQLEIESYQTKLNLTQPDWDASDFLFKEDYTIVSKPRALDHMVKDFKLFKYNLGMTTRIWSEDNRRRSKDFMENIRVIPKYHNEDGNPARANIKQALGRYEHGGLQDTRPQDGERSQDDDQRLDLADDLKKSQDHISSTHTRHKTKSTTSMYKISHEESKTTKISIYDFLTLPTWENAKAVEEPHELASSILQRVQNNTTTPIFLRRKASSSLVGPSEPDEPRRKRELRKKVSEVRSSAPAAEEAKDVDGVDVSGADYYTYLENFMERDKGTSSRVVSAPSRLGKRLGLPPPLRLSHTDSSDPSHVGTSNAAHASSTDHGVVREAKQDLFKWDQQVISELVEKLWIRRNNLHIPDPFVCNNIESVPAQVVAAAKLPVLNTNEFELWKMRIEQYFLMTDYALWEVIVNGDSPPNRFSMPSIRDLALFCRRICFCESVINVPAIATSEVKTSESKPKFVSEPLIKDWISDSEDENETKSKSKQRKPSFAKIEFVKSNEHVKTHRESVKKVENNKRAEYPRKNSQSPRGFNKMEQFKIDQLEVNLERFKIDQAAINSEAAKLWALLQETIEKNKVEADRQFAEIMSALKARQSPTTLPATIPRFEENSGQSFSGKEIKDNCFKGAHVTEEVADECGDQSRIREKDVPSHGPRKRKRHLGGQIFGLELIIGLHCDPGRGEDRVTWNPGINHHPSEMKWNFFLNSFIESNIMNNHVFQHFRPDDRYERKAVKRRVWDPGITGALNQSGSYHTVRPKAVGNPQQDLKDKGIINSGCSRHMTGNRSYLTDYEDIDGGFIAFGGSTKGGKITGKGKIRTGKLDIEDVYFVKELKFNLFSVSQMCDKKNSVLFTDTECAVLSSNFKLTDESHVMLKVPRKDNMYSIDLKNVFLKEVSLVSLQNPH